jgi:hypothetical protein
MNLQKGRGIMPLVAAGRAVPAALFAVLTVAACSSALSPGGSANQTGRPAANQTAARPDAALPAANQTSASPAANQTSASQAAPALAGSGCRQLYETWNHNAATTAFKANLKYIVSKRGADHITQMTSVLERAGSAAPGLPLPPHCADPADYYSRVAAKIKRIADNARSAIGLGPLLTAEAPLKSVKVIEGKLSTEVNQTVGEPF